MMARLPWCWPRGHRHCDRSQHRLCIYARYDQAADERRTSLEKQIEAEAQEAASLKTLREKFLLLTETGDRAAIEHVRELEKREVAARRRIKEVHLGIQPLA
jgi:hypothetical protein